jgi:hypothetical protein
MRYRNRLLSTVVLLLACVLVGSPSALAAKHMGFVDSAPFVEIAGEDAVTIEIDLSGALLQTIGKIDEDLHELIGGLESIHAVVLQLNGSGRSESARRAIIDIENDLKARSWQRIAMVREEDGEVRVLTLADGDAIQGLVVMIIDLDEGELVFANIAGTLDLAAIQSLGDGLGIPGIDDLEIGE